MTELRPETLPSTGRRVPGIEGLRAIAAGSIVLVHVWGVSMPHGEVLARSHPVGDGISALSAGVTLFFTLSGFLLYRPFAAAIARRQTHQSFSAYARNRFLRIAPAYLVILVVTALVVGAANVRDAGGGLGTGRITDPLELAQTAFLLQDYRPDTVVIGIGPAWSLAVEVVFYLILPLLVLLAAGFARRARDRRGRVLALLAPAAILLVIGLSGKLAAGHLVPGNPLAGYNADWHSVIERSFWAQADLFVFGMVVAVLHVEVSDGRVALPSRWRVFAAAAAVLIFIPCTLSMPRAEHSFLLQNTGEALALALALATVVIPNPGARARLGIRVLESRAFVAVGLVSYSLFLWHYPVVVWLRDHGFTSGGVDGLVLNAGVVTAVAGTLSALSYHYVERPALRRKRRGVPTPTVEQPVTRPPAPAAALASAGD